MPRKQQQDSAPQSVKADDGWSGEGAGSPEVVSPETPPTAQAETEAAQGTQGTNEPAAPPNSQEQIANSQPEEKKEPEKLTGEAARKAQIEARVAEDVARNAPVPTEPDDALPDDPIRQALKECDALCEQCEGNVMKAYELVNQIRAIAPRSKLDKAIKAAVLERASKFCFEMQQGLPQVRMDANTLAKEPALRMAGVQEERIELRARGDKDIADLREENLRLKKLLENQGQGQEQE